MSAAGCQGELVDGPAFDGAPQVVSASGRSLVPFDNGDSTYSYPLDELFATEATVTFGAVTWRYDRQARYAIEMAPSVPRTFVHEGDREPTSGWDELARLKRLDAEGRQWSVDDIDVDEWSAVVADANTKLEAAGERIEEASYEDPDTRIVDHASGYEIGEEITRSYLTWSTGCNNVTLDQRWDTDDRTSVTSLNERQKAMVSIHNSTLFGSPLICSGVLLDNMTVLTAAHCVSTCNATIQDPVGQRYHLLVGQFHCRIELRRCGRHPARSCIRPEQLHDGHRSGRRLGHHQLGYSDACDHNGHGPLPTNDPRHA